MGQIRNFTAGEMVFFYVDRAQIWWPGWMANSLVIDSDTATVEIRPEELDMLKQHLPVAAARIGITASHVVRWQDLPVGTPLIHRDPEHVKDLAETRRNGIMFHHNRRTDEGGLQIVTNGFTYDIRGVSDPASGKYHRWDYRNLKPRRVSGWPRIAELGAMTGGLQESLRVDQGTVRVINPDIKVGDYVQNGIFNGWVKRRTNKIITIDDLDGCEYNIEGSADELEKKTPPADKMWHKDHGIMDVPSGAKKTQDPFPSVPNTPVAEYQYRPNEFDIGDYIKGLQYEGYVIGVEPDNYRISIDPKAPGNRDHRWDKDRLWIRISKGHAKKWTPYDPIQGQREGRVHRPPVGVGRIHEYPKAQAYLANGLDAVEKPRLPQVRDIDLSVDIL